MIVLDTHAWIWWMSEPDRLSAKARETIAEADSVGVSTLSVWELATLTSRGRVSLDRNVKMWVRRAFAEPRVEPLPLSIDIALAAGHLDQRSFPGDPIDRIIYSTASATDAPLVTRDAAIRAFDPQSTVW